MKKSRNQLLKERYHFFRAEGYSAQEANKLKHRTKAYFVDTSGFVLKKNVKNKTYLVKNKYYRTSSLDNFIETKKRVRNRSVYSNWGNLTQNSPHNDQMLKRATEISRRDKESLDYGFYYLYYMFTQNKTDSEMRNLTKIDKSFEIYVKNKNNQIVPNKQIKREVKSVNWTKNKIEISNKKMVEKQKREEKKLINKLLKDRKFIINKISVLKSKKNLNSTDRIELKKLERELKNIENFLDTKGVVY